MNLGPTTPGSRRTTARAICESIGRRVGVRVTMPVRNGERLADVEIVGVAADDACVPGEMGWVSETAVRADPARVTGFTGSLLFMPALSDVSFLAPPNAVLVESPDPKRAFAEVVRWYWPRAGEIAWPGENGGVGSASLAGVVRGPECNAIGHANIGLNTVIANTDAEGFFGAVSIGANCSIGLSGFGFVRDIDGKHRRFPHVGRVILFDEVEIGSNVTIDRGALGDTIVRAGAKIDNHVHIAHNADIGERVIIVAGAMIGGSVKIGADAFIALGAVVRNKVTIGAGAVVGMGAVVTKDVEPGHVVVGNPARTIRVKGAT